MHRWSFDPAYSTVEFRVRNLWYTVRGRFHTLEGWIDLDETDVNRSCVSATIKTSSIDTGNKRRDAHLRSPEFFDVERFPEIEFTSTNVKRGQDRDSLDLEGTLTFKGQSKRIALAVNEMDRSRSPRGEEFIYYSATTELDRCDLGISYGRGIIGRKVKITINVQATTAHDFSLVALGSE